MRDQFSRWSKSSGIAIAFLLLVIASALVEPSSLGRAALAAFWPFVGVLMVVGVGQQLIIQQRGIDLSAPGFISLSAIIVSHMPNGNNSLLIPSIFLAFGVAIVAGFVNGFMVTRVGIMPIVQTLGMNAVLYGINVAICHGTPTQTTTHLFNFMNDHVFGLQMPFVLGVIVIVAVELVMKKTIVGRRFEASGASERAGLAAGLRTNRYRYMAYVGSAMLYTLAGVMLAGIIQQPDVFQGDTYLLLSVAAVVLGGTALLGGAGSPVATAFGAAFLIQLQGFVLATGATAAVQDIVQAVALAIGISVYGLRSSGGLSKFFKRPRTTRGHNPSLVSNPVSTGSST
jgi:ribose transport system permease protein